MGRKTVSGIVLILLTVPLVSAILVRGASPPSIIHVSFDTGYIVNPYGAERWDQGIALHVTDPDGLDNFFIDGEISIEILAPDGYTYPMPGDELVVTTVPPYGIWIRWCNPLPDPPVLGSYEITITDKDGLSTTYVTQPTVRVSDRVPTITYPPNFGVILETNPTFTWEAFSPGAETQWHSYMLEVSGPGLEWLSPDLSPDQLSYMYDGPALIRGETYCLRVFVFEDEVVGENEIRRVHSVREISFTLGHAFTATIDIDPNTLNLRSQGKWITAYIELPEGYDVSEINVSTIMLNDTIAVNSEAPTEIGDHDEDGILDLIVKFDRQEVMALLSIGEATLTITGQVNDTLFEGSDIIRVVDE